MEAVRQCFVLFLMCKVDSQCAPKYEPEMKIKQKQAHSSFEFVQLSRVSNQNKVTDQVDHGEDRVTMDGPADSKFGFSRS